ncbi:MAG: DUF4199 domain-containing protein [Chryseolinea sp.]
MRRAIITYGMIAGAIVAGMMFATVPLWKSGTVTSSNGELLGYTTMIIALSLVFFGIKSCRDNYFKGSISFGQCVKIGMLITLIASVMYALAWEVCYNTVMSDFTENMADHRLEEMKAAGKNAAEIADVSAQMESFKEWYKNPVLRFGVTLLEILPVGIVITLISAAFLRKRSLIQPTA